MERRRNTVSGIIQLKVELECVVSVTCVEVNVWEAVGSGVGGGADGEPWEFTIRPVGELDDVEHGVTPYGLLFPARGGLSAWWRGR